MTNPRKLKEIICFTHKKIDVYLEIDYYNNKISLLEPSGNGLYRNKQWLFAGRGVNSMNGWLNIMEAMQEAVKLAKKMYEHELAETSKFDEKKAIEEVKKINKPSLRCESCGLMFEDNEYSATDWQNIDEMGECIECSLSHCKFH